MSTAGSNVVVNQQRRPRVGGWVIWLGAFIAALLLYVATADRGPQWQDSGTQQLRIVTGELHHPRGLVLTHPLQHYLGRLAVYLLPLEPAFAITLVSSFAAAIAIANLALTLWVTTRWLPAVLIASAAFMLSHTFWQHATHTESYTILVALLTGEWLCLAWYVSGPRPRVVLLLAFLNGLGIANHLLALLATPIDAIVVLHVARQRRLPIGQPLSAGALWLLGTLPYSGLVAWTLITTGDFWGTLHSAFFGDFAADVLNLRVGLRAALVTLGYIGYNFPGLIIPLAFYGLLTRFNQLTLFTRALKYELLIYFVFVARYPIVDQYTFFVPVYALLAVFAGLGMKRLSNGGSAIRRRVLLRLAAITAIWTPLIYIAVPAVLESRGVFASMVGNKPYRNGYHALFRPWGVGQTYVNKLNQHAFQLAGSHGLILYEDGVIGVSLLYAREVGHAPQSVHVERVESTVPASQAAEDRALLQSCLAQGRPVVLVPRNRDQPNTCVQEALWQRDGDLYVLKTLAVSKPDSATSAPEK
jgi:hypothetical protein